MEALMDQAGTDTPLAIELARLDRMSQEALEEEMDRIVFDQVWQHAPASQLTADGFRGWFDGARRRILQSVFRGAHEGLCGEGSSVLRTAVLGAAGIASGAALIASGLVSMGVASALAAAAAAWIWKYLIVPFGEGFCSHWADSLPGGVQE
jgi:hypothetical protein